MNRNGLGRLGVVAAILGLAATVGIGLAPDRTLPESSQVMAEPGPSIAQDEGWITVHVAGWVTSPGLVRVPVSALVADAVAAAGGARAGAFLDGLNLAARVGDGDQIQVPGPGGQADAGEPGDGLVDINRADETELQVLPGVGPVLAARIVAFRESNGPFEAVEDLLEVPGIGEAKLASLADLIAIR